jgi:hypothetical protein
MIVDRSFKAGIISRKEERSISLQTLSNSQSKAFSEYENDATITAF